MSPSSQGRGFVLAVSTVLVLWLLAWWVLRPVDPAPPDEAPSQVAEEPSEPPEGALQDPEGREPPDAPPACEPKRLRVLNDPILELEDEHAPLYLRCPRLVGGPGEERSLLVRLQDDQGRSGLGMVERTSDGEGWESKHRPVLELGDLGSAGVRVIGCAAVATDHDRTRAFVSARLEDERRVILELQLDQSGRLVLVDDEPVLQATEPWMRDGLWEPWILQEPERWLMVLRCGSRTRGTLCLARSDDGESWTLDPEPLLRDVETRDRHVDAAPVLVRVQDGYHLWYTRKSYEKGKTGKVVSGSLHWLEADEVELFEEKKGSAMLRPGETSWSQAIVDTPHVVYRPDKVVVLFRGGNDTKHGVIGVAKAGCKREPDDTGKP